MAAVLKAAPNLVAKFLLNRSTEDSERDNPLESFVLKLNTSKVLNSNSSILVFSVTVYSWSFDIINFGSVTKQTNKQIHYKILNFNYKSEIIWLLSTAECYTKVSPTRQEGKLLTFQESLFVPDIFKILVLFASLLNFLSVQKKLWAKGT
jgi:hypothetical protein